MLLSFIAVTTRQTVLSGLLIALLLAAILFLVSVAFGVLLGSTKWWGIAVGLVVTDLLLGGVIAILDRFGMAR